MTTRPATTGAARTPPVPTTDDTGLARTIRVSLWVLTLTVRSAMDAVRTRNARHV